MLTNQLDAQYTSASIIAAAKTIVHLKKSTLEHTNHSRQTASAQIANRLKQKTKKHTTPTGNLQANFENCLQIKNAVI